MPDLSHMFGDDLILGPTNDLGQVDGALLGEQRILRRLLTAICGYLFQQGYGAGVPQMIGRATPFSLIESLIVSQILQEQGVAASPPAQVSVTPVLNGVQCVVTYYEAASGQQRTLTFDPTQKT